MAIMTPLKPRMGRRVTLCLAMTTWLLGILISWPYLIVYTTAEVSEERVVCYPEWPDGSSGESMYEYM